MPIRVILTAPDDSADFGTRDMIDLCREIEALAEIKGDALATNIEHHHNLIAMNCASMFHARYFIDRIMKHATFPALLRYLPWKIEYFLVPETLPATP